MRQQLPNCLAAVALSVVLPFLFAQPASAQNFNRIEGTVWNEYHQPVPDVYVELMNSMEGDLARSRTTGSGRFTFGGLSVGRFKIHVVTSGTNYLDDSQDVEIIGTGVRNSTEVRYVDFYLKLDPKKINVGSGGPPEAVFVQDVPESARKLFKKGVSDIKSEKGMKLVEDAIAAYPDYFDALAAAGKEYVNKGDFAKGVVYLVRAARVNDRSYSVYGSLAYGAYKLNKYPEALEAARLAVSLEPKAINSRLLLARVLRLTGDLQGAESMLVETKKVAADTPQVYYELALVYNRQNRNAEAAAELETYLKLFPNDPERKNVMNLIATLKASSTPTKLVSNE